MDKQQLLESLFKRDSSHVGAVRGGTGLVGSRHGPLVIGGALNGEVLAGWELRGENCW